MSEAAVACVWIECSGVLIEEYHDTVTLVVSGRRGRGGGGASSVGDARAA